MANGQIIDQFYRTDQKPLVVPPLAGDLDVAPAASEVRGPRAIFRDFFLNLPDQYIELMGLIDPGPQAPAPPPTWWPCPGNYIEAMRWRIHRDRG